MKFRSHLFSQYKIDLLSVYSASNMAFKVYRRNFLKTSIPTLYRSEDRFIRKSYLGGASDVYYPVLAKGGGAHLYYYDVNSLYPYVMCKDLPYKVKKKWTDLSLTALEREGVDKKDFFGFVKAEVICNKEKVSIPILPYKILNPDKNNNLQYPYGNWVGYYFSEELKKAEELGYKINYLEGYEFDKMELFTEYVEHFYQIKREVKGAERSLAKLMLNGLYGSILVYILT